MVANTTPQAIAEVGRRPWLQKVRGRLLAVMREIETLPEGSSGALIVGHDEPPAGMILIEHNRVCWTAALGMSRRLTDILRNHASLPVGTDEIEAIYARCREDGRPLGEALVDSGLVAPEQLRLAMRQHTVESLLAIDASLVVGGAADGGREWPFAFIAHRERSYNPRYTFSAAEVLAAVGAQLLDATAAEVLGDHLHEIAESGATFIAYADGDDVPLFVGIGAPHGLSVDDMLDLWRWASAATEASPGFSPIVAHAWSQSADAGAIAWTYEGHGCAALCPDRQALQRLVAMLDTRSLAMVLASRLDVLDRVRERSALTND